LAAAYLVKWPLLLVVVARRDLVQVEIQVEILPLIRRLLSLQAQVKLAKSHLVVDKD
jgi:hypothetical protein